MARTGRKSVYETPFVQEAARQCLLGATDDELAAHFGVARSTLSEWKRKFPDFSDAIKRGKGPADGVVAAALFGRAKGAEWIEEQAIKVKRVEYKDGKRLLEVERVEIVKVRRSAPADTTAAIFWLKNRRPDVWRDKSEMDIRKLGDMSDAELEALAAGRVP